jgi:uncharacterized membrane protein YiaA
MLGLSVGDVYAVLTFLFVVGLIVFSFSVLKARVRIEKWGRLVGLFILFGTVVSGLSAMRDKYGTVDGLFPMDSMQSTICSIAGGLIFLIGFLTLIIRNQTFRKGGFPVVVSLFVVQVLTIEISRIAFMAGVI